MLNWRRTIGFIPRTGRNGRRRRSNSLAREPESWRSSSPSARMCSSRPARSGKSPDCSGTRSSSRGSTRSSGYLNIAPVASFAESPRGLVSR